MKNQEKKSLKIKSEGYIDKELADILQGIEPADREAMSIASERQAYLVKVPGSLGKLEDMSIRLAGITGKPYGNTVDKQAIILMCGDNGVVEEGVASAPQTVTLMQTINFTKKITGVGSQAKYFGIDLLPVDIGVKLPIPEEYLSDEMTKPRESKGVGACKHLLANRDGDHVDQREIDPNEEELRLVTDHVINRRIASGTKNLAIEPAMTKEEAIRAIKVGSEAVDACLAAGKNIIGVGEMGIGNTTTATAIIGILAPLIQAEYGDNELSDDDGGVKLQDIVSGVDSLVGRGGGLSNEGLSKKREVIKNAIKKYADDIFDKEGFLDPLECVRHLGGFDIAGMTGCYLRAAAKKVPVVIDGVISMAAALLAFSVCPDVIDYMFMSHKSKEGSYGVAAKAFNLVEPGISPMYDLGMRLGEGSGCPIAFKILEAACAVMNNMWSLEDAQVDSEYLEEFRKDGQFN